MIKVLDLRLRGDDKGGARKITKVERGNDEGGARKMIKVKNGDGSRKGRG